MPIVSINPATEEELASYDEISPAELDHKLDLARKRFQSWRRESPGRRSHLMATVAAVLRAHKEGYARLATAEMGKPITEAEAEVEKCAVAAEYFAENAEAMLAPRAMSSSASRSHVQFLPLGTVLAVMPWNFPFWQAFRAAIPALMAGNVIVLKHASNVPQVALAIEEAFNEAGFPAGVFQTLLLGSGGVSGLIADDRVVGVTLTGSDVAGARVAADAGKALKKTVLELGGSDPFVVLEDADVDEAARVACRARNQNNGESCIAAKRFIVVEAVADRFESLFCDRVAELKVGDPLDRGNQVGPLARRDLVDNLRDQLDRSVAAGARVAVGGFPIQGRGYYFQPTVVKQVRRDTAVMREETFGPLAALIRVRDEAEAIETANDTQFGLGSNIWTTAERGERLASEIEAGMVYVNGMVASEARLPFGGIKRSGYGRELSEFGIREFTNVQTVWVGPPASPSQPQGKPAE